MADETTTAAEARAESLADAIGDADQLVGEIQESLETVEEAERSVTPMALDELHEVPTGEPSLRDLDLLADVEVEVTVEFGRTVMPLRQLLALRRGSLVPLGRRPEQQVTVLANGTPVAYGDIVVVGDQIGVHIVELVDPNATPPPAPAPAQVDLQEVAEPPMAPMTAALSAPEAPTADPGENTPAEPDDTAGDH